MNFGPNNLVDLCAVATAVLVQEFPEQEWVVLPDVAADKGQVGLFISTRVGEERVVVSRPMVNILTPLELGTPLMLRELVGAIGKELDAIKNPPPVTEGNDADTAVVETPLASVAAGKKKK